MIVNMVQPLTRPILSSLTDAITAALGGGYAAIINDDGQLAPYVTFTRSSTATYYGSDGLLKTAAANEPRYDYDPVTLQLRGLLIEEQRTNLLLDSASLSTQTRTVTAVAHTLSFQGTGTVTLSGASTAGPLVGTGANNRVTLTFTPTAGSLTLTVSGTVTNAQLEAGTFATSYIPTTMAAVTRAADVARVPALSSIGFNPTEGTLFAQASFMAPAPHTSVQGIVSIQNNAFTNFHLINRQTAGALFGTSVDSGVSQAYPNTGLMPTNTVFKTAYAYKANDFGICTNGGTPVTDNAGTVASAVNTMLVGNASGLLNGHIRRLRYYPRRLSNQQLQALTT